MPDVVILGAGLAGLACAAHLTRAGVEVELHEASDAVGGRARTDVVDGMLLDRGFQVLNTAYPEARRALDLDALDLQPFVRGALLRYGPRLHRIADPRSAPTWALSSLRAPIGSPKDKAALVALALRPLRLDAPERSTYDHLRAHGVSDVAIDRFVRPFLTGVFLDPELVTSSRFFSVIWRTFAFGTQALPATGMGAMAQQLAASLPAGALQLDAAHTDLPTARAVVVATDAATAADLLDLPEPAFRSVTTHYHLADRPPTPYAAIVLDGERSGPVTNTCVLTNVAPTYAPGRVLVSSSVVGSVATEAEVREHLSRLYGVSTAGWQHVSSYALPQALPSMAPPLGTLRKPVRVRDGVYVCGDHRDTASIQGALVSGRRAATAVLRDLGDMSVIVAGSACWRADAQRDRVAGPVFDLMAELAGDPVRPRLTFVTTAGPDGDAYTGVVHEAFAGTRFDVQVLRLMPMPNVADPARLLLESDLVWVGGGSVAGLLALWRLHGLDEAMTAAWEAGVVLGGISAGSLCWHVGGTTDSFGPDLRPITNGLALLPYGCGVHYDSEAQRRPLLQQLVGKGVLPLSYATDDGAALVYRDTEVVEAVADRPGAGAYRVELVGGEVVETSLPVRLLG